MNSPIGHILSIAVVRDTSEPVARAWCSCRHFEWRCSLGSIDTAFAKAKEHAILSTYIPPSGRVNLPAAVDRPYPTLAAKEDG
jgi:hypothetical protein